MTEEDVERVARALCAADWGLDRWDRSDEQGHKVYRTRARAAITAYLATEPGEVGLRKKPTLHFTNEWLRRKIESDPDDAEIEAGAPELFLSQPATENAELVAMRDACQKVITALAGRVHSRDALAAVAACEAALSAPGGEAK